MTAALRFAPDADAAMDDEPTAIRSPICSLLDGFCRLPACPLCSNLPADIERRALAIQHFGIAWKNVTDDEIERVFERLLLK